MAEATLSLMTRLEDLRRRLIIAAAAWLVAFGLCYSQAEQIFRWVAGPVRTALPQGVKLIFLTATEPFFTYLKVSAIAALIMALPIILWQIWFLAAPTLYARHKIFALCFVALAYLCFLAGSFLGFTYVFPLIFNVLVDMGVNDGGVNAMLSMDAYLGLALTMLIAFGSVFELPLVITLLARFGLVDHHWLRRNRKYMIIVAFVFGGVITPGPDVISQSSIAIPFIILYEVGIVGARLFGRRRPAEESESAALLPS